MKININDILNKVKSIKLEDVTDGMAYTFIGSVALMIGFILLFSLIYLPMFFLFMAAFLTGGYFLGKYLVHNTHG